MGGSRAEVLLPETTANVPMKRQQRWVCSLVCTPNMFVFNIAATAVFLASGMRA